MLTAGEPVTFELIPDADKFNINIKEDRKCLELTKTGSITLSECADTAAGKLFFWTEP